VLLPSRLPLQPPSPRSGSCAIMNLMRSSCLNSTETHTTDCPEQGKTNHQFEIARHANVPYHCISRLQKQHKDSNSRKISIIQPQQKAHSCSCVKQTTSQFFALAPILPTSSFCVRHDNLAATMIANAICARTCVLTAAVGAAPVVFAWLLGMALRRIRLRLVLPGAGDG
jgi:hypothetical protein